jgi:hypothetical protein
VSSSPASWLQSLLYTLVFAVFDSGKDLHPAHRLILGNYELGEGIEPMVDIPLTKLG